VDNGLVDGAAGRRVLRLECYRAEGLLVLGEIVSEQIEESLGLLRAEIDALEMFQLDFLCGVLTDDAEYEEKIPHTDADADAVGIAFAVLLGAAGDDVRLVGWRLGLGHR
jgi:hypothetical protein